VTRTKDLPWTVDRLLPNAEAEDLLALTRQIADAELAPIAADYEAQERYPERAFRVLGEAGLLSLPYPEEYGGGGQPFEVYLQVLEELAARWAAVAVAVSVHGLACFSLSRYGTSEQKQRWLPAMLAGDRLGAYSLSEPHAGSDPAAIVCTAKKEAVGYRINGTKAWITNGGKAGFYTLFARTSDDGGRGISCFLTPGQLEGLTFGVAERKMGLAAVPTTTAHWDDALVTADRLIGLEGQGLPIALSALDTGRLGIAAIAVGLAQSAMQTALSYAKERQTFGKRIIDHQGVGFMLADMAAGVATARAMYLDAARKKDRGRPYAQEASVAKLVATDTAMRVTTDAVQVMGGIGYTKDVPAERYMREAKVMQIFEGTNQIQRMVISRLLCSG
jgi:alkylation response protein AidB-like acyl-CoA dehydrogenase